uniref:uncharacterized protein LOC120345958 n=1 Tax=Styela clava TaxID=7725 RepID=UPI00193AABF9|nr:uncharacterized protein LOC120345958 [Styela clava]XP_039271508.1 uncharacterized protein LOC120345958 [Styela clava]
MASMKIVQLLFFALFVACTANGVNQQRICMQLEAINVEDEQSAIERTRNPYSSRPGKRGAKGDVGPAGLKGSSGEVDYRRINRAIQENVEIECNKVNTGLVGRINKMEEMIRKMNRTVSDPRMQLKLQGLCPVQYLGHCFWSVVHSSKDINVDEAKRICGVNNGFPANVYNEQHLNDLMADIRRKISADTFIWTGMQVDISTNAVLMRDGTRASYVKWWTSGFPNAGESGLYIHVQTDPSSSRQGMGNDPPTSKSHGVICEK